VLCSITASSRTVHIVLDDLDIKSRQCLDRGDLFLGAY
jgi:hypothetical protein